jgi:tetratricopeptide (TPR) repeat protein
MTLSNNKKRKIKDMLAQAKEALAAGRLAPFEGLCRKIERLHPGNPDVTNLRAIASYKTGRPAEAESLFAAAIKAAPARHEFHNNLGALYLDQGHYAEAAKCYGEAIRLGEKSFPVQLSHCNALVESGQFEQALPILKRLHKQKPRDTNVLMGLFLASDPLRLTEEAEDYLRQIIAIDPEHAEAHSKMGRLALQLGRMAEAEAEARKLLAILPGSPRAYDILTYAKPYQDADDPDITAMRELHAQSTPDSGDRRAMCFMLGRVMEQLGHYDRAFPYFAEGNAIHRKLSRYRADQDLAGMDRIMAVHPAQGLPQASSVADDVTPILIVGMPRCGSTLVEQILASHPDVDSRGEYDTFESKALLTNNDRMPDPEELAAFTPAQWERVGLSYVQHLRGGDTTSLRIVDKTLTNFRMLGAIHRALPKAKIVHVRRHPLDTCLSIYKLALVGDRYDYGYDLGELGRYYRKYLEMMQHWRDVLPAGTMYELDYERLVANQEQETRKLLDYCGLPWDARCLQFKEAKNVVRTSSMAQVRRDMYTDSVAAWKRYEKQLQPLIRILGTSPPNIR